ncbi:MAG: antibiotic biosynthesis monooxygenase, partial [Altererythrobacter sp.]|nr:antibiotic biosynthesis monooxygenase [Altererythrobacter sp.]
ERWESQEALAAHGKSAHMAEFQKVMAANPPVGRDLRIYNTDEGNPL